MKLISIRKRVVDMDVINDVKCTLQIVFTHVLIVFITQNYPLNNSDVI